MYSSDAHTNVYKGSIAVWRGVGKSARGMRRGMFRSRADQWRENMVATGCGIHQRRYSAYTFWDLSFLLSSLLVLLYLFFLFSLFLFSLFLFHFDRSRVYTSVYNETPKGVCEKKASSIENIRNKGNRLRRLLSPNIPLPREKNHPPVFTPTFGYLETHYRAPLREYGLRPFLKSYTISRIRAYPVYCVAHSRGTNDTPFVLLLFRLSRLRWMVISMAI